ncbi:MAG: M81 family metallopeptidase, partial [Synergistales bacterium]|nr:M81 family metallopeptidase [Synergistales bacterium]
DLSIFAQMLVGILCNKGEILGGIFLRPRILCAEFHHETNSFCSTKTGMQEYQNLYILYGGDIVSKFKGVKMELGGFIETCAEEKLELIPTIAANAMPGGPVTREVFDLVKTEILRELSRQNPIQGVLLSLHGAMVLEDVPDGEGELVSAIREAVGPEVPIIATLDLHANITQKMVDQADALFVYDTNPHVDQYERAVEAAHLMAQCVTRSLKPTMKMKKIPILSPVLSTSEDPYQQIMQRVHEWEKHPEVLSVSLAHGFPWSDFKEVGIAVVAITKNNSLLANDIVNDIDALIWAKREEFIKPLVSLDEAIKMSQETEEGPVILADVADNPGGGTPGDGTQLLSGLIRANLSDVAFASIVDPETVKDAIRAGVGSLIPVKLGGKTEIVHGEPLKVMAQVKTIADGVFINKGPMRRGFEEHMGKAVVLGIGGIDVIVHERKLQPWDPEFIRRMGIEPRDRKVIVLKSAMHFRAAFTPIAKKIIDVDVPGLLSMNFQKMSFKYISRPAFPIDVFDR